MVKEYFKSLSNTSTNSVESGFFELDVAEDEAAGGVSAAACIGEKVKQILSEAVDESRLICGWKEAIRHLNETEFPEHSLFFFLVPSTAGDDKLSHMQEVMTRAFCLANDIYVIQLDSAAKLSKILGSKSGEEDSSGAMHSCALLQRSSTLKLQSRDDEIDLDEFTPLENEIIDYCEEFWCEPIQPIVRLPED